MTAAEADADGRLLDPREMAAWGRYWYTDELPAWTPVAELGQEMRPAYEAAAGTTGEHREVAEAYFQACARAVASPEVGKAVDLFVRDLRFRLTVTHPDDGREFYPPSE
ncbi:hypothetical protein [Urbifossiella limnaea]|uniref:hypothetical protein n=1 Tax=Urbifossiella limnaea TaxID=2528023 RepID=UPI0011A636A0|nr:hypothetical protein [Urbifossiella limnaea]